MHAELEAFEMLPVFDAGMRPKLKCSIPGIRRSTVVMPCEGLKLTNLRLFQDTLMYTLETIEGCEVPTR